MDSVPRLNQKDIFLSQFLFPILLSFVSVFSLIYPVRTHAQLANALLIPVASRASAFLAAGASDAAGAVLARSALSAAGSAVPYVGAALALAQVGKFLYDRYNKEPKEYTPEGNNSKPIPRPSLPADMSLDTQIYWSYNASTGVPTAYLGPVESITDVCSTLGGGLSGLYTWFRSGNSCFVQVAGSTLLLAKDGSSGESCPAGVPLSYNATVNYCGTADRFTSGSVRQYLQAKGYEPPQYGAGTVGGVTGGSLPSSSAASVSGGSTGKSPLPYTQTYRDAAGAVTETVTPGSAGGVVVNTVEEFVTDQGSSVPAAERYKTEKVETEITISSSGGITGNAKVTVTKSGTASNSALPADKTATQTQLQTGSVTDIPAGTALPTGTSTTVNPITGAVTVTNPASSSNSTAFPESIAVSNIDRANICTQMPTLSMCQEHVYDPITDVCSGDPIACAVAKSVREMKEALNPAEALKTAGNALLSPATASMPTLPEKVVDLTDRIAFVGGAFGNTTGHCPAPHTFTVLGHQYEFGFDLICRFANNVRGIVILSSVLIGLRIIFV